MRVQLRASNSGSSCGWEGVAKAWKRGPAWSTVSTSVFKWVSSGFNPHTHTYTVKTSALEQRLNFDFPVHFTFITSLAKSFLTAKLFSGLSNLSKFISPNLNISEILFLIFLIPSVFQPLLRTGRLCLPKICMLKHCSNVLVIRR